MIRKKGFAFIGVTLIGFSILFTCFSAIGEENSISDKEQSKKITQENNNETKIVNDYISVPFERLIGTAKLIVTGTVEDVGDSGFKFYIDEYLLHRHVSRTIDVTKYIPAEIFACRSLPYEKGQRFTLFLTKSGQNRTDQPWNIIGHAGEGEMPIDDDFIYFEGYDLKGLEHKPREVHGVTREIQRFNVNDFKDAVKKYHECFSWELVEYIKNNKKRERWQPSKRCPDVTVENYQARSWLHEYLFQKTINKIPLNTNE